MQQQDIYTKVAMGNISKNLNLDLYTLLNANRGAKAYIEAYKRLKNKIVKEYQARKEEFKEIDISIDIMNILDKYEELSI